MLATPGDADLTMEGVLTERDGANARRKRQVGLRHGHEGDAQAACCHRRHVVHLELADLSVQGIQDVTRAQLDGWRAAGVVPKLVGYVGRLGDGLRAGVELRTYPASDAFALVRGKDKAIRVATDAMGEVLAVGCGPEPVATAAAALKDLEHILMHHG